MAEGLERSLKNLIPDDNCGQGKHTQEKKQKKLKNRKFSKDTRFLTAWP